LLTRRAVSREVGEKLISFIHWWEDHVRLFKATIDNNPTYGNKEGGLSTIYEKSLGAVAKGGSPRWRRFTGTPKRSTRRVFVSWTRPASIR